MKPTKWAVQSRLNQDCHGHNQGAEFAGKGRMELDWCWLCVSSFRRRRVGELACLRAASGVGAAKAPASEELRLIKKRRR